MQTAETVLTAIQKCGTTGTPLTRVYRHLFNRELYLLAYGNIHGNKGALTPGTTAETVDGMSLAKIDSLIERLRQERHHWTPVRRTYIEKRNSMKKRPLGIPSWTDKLLQEAIRLLLDAYYEPRFSAHSHGFRKGRGPNSALHEIHRTWYGTTWFIEGDIQGCFDNIDHTILLSILAESIHDNRFLRLIQEALDAGYLEDWQWKPTLSGTPQGGILSPLLANIYLDRLDQFVDTQLLPEHTRGEQRAVNPAYHNARGRYERARKRGDHARAKEEMAFRQRIPSGDPSDPGYRRLKYIRYADDFLLGFIGPKDEAETIKHTLRDFLRDHLKLELSEEKTAITHARTSCARFLGYDLHTIQNDSKRSGGQRTYNGCIGFRIPQEVVLGASAKYLSHGQPIHLPERTNDSVFDIMREYQAEYRGIVNYYRRAYNLSSIARLKWAMQGSLTKTLARKLKISVRKVYLRYRAYKDTPNGPRITVLRTVVQREGKEPLVAEWGGISTKWSHRAVIIDPGPKVWNTRRQLLARLLRDTCELCGSTEYIEIHHIRHLKDLHTKGRKVKPLWIQRMAALRRKTLVVCRSCHDNIHNGYPTTFRKRTYDTGEPDAMKAARPVRRGADGKVPA